MPSSLSPQRQRLWQLWRLIGRIVKRLDTAAPMTPGSLYRMGRKCGQPNCRCNRGMLHYTWVVSRSELGRARRYLVSENERTWVRQITGQYRRYQRGRARLVKLLTELMRRVDRMAQTCQVRWPSRKGTGGSR